MQKKSKERSIALKETVKKHFFAPVWRLHEIEAELERLEKEGWRLDKICGFRGFIFVKSRPRAAKYFFTCSFARERGMILIEEALKSKHGANQISGGFIEGLKITAVYRMTEDKDLSQSRINRCCYLAHLVLQYVWLALFGIILSTAGLVLSMIFEGPDAFHFILLLFAIGAAVDLLYHLRGYLYLRKQYKGYFEAREEQA